MKVLADLLLSGDGRLAASFIRAWHGSGDELISVSLAQSSAKRLTTLFSTCRDMADRFDADGIDTLCYLDGAAHNVYHSSGYAIQELDKFKRGGKRNVAAVPGVWLDLDVKEGSFTSEEHILGWLETLPFRPTIAVATGSGGVQAYWKVLEPLKPTEAEALGRRWWMYAQSRCDVVVDKLQNCDRILRTPGGIRWPKKDESPSLVQMLWNDGPLADLKMMLDLTNDVYLDNHRHVVEAQSSLNQTGEVANVSIFSDINIENANRWTIWQLMGREGSGDSLENRFNARYTWADILEPHGWTDMGKDYDGRTLWMRPGGSRKSAATDYTESYLDENKVLRTRVSQVMSLFSDAAETGLSHLAQVEKAGAALTKYRVHIELTWGGDEEAFVREFLKYELGDNGQA